MKPKPTFKLGNQQRDAEGNIIKTDVNNNKFQKPKNVNSPAKIGRRSGTRGS